MHPKRPAGTQLVNHDVDKEGVKRWYDKSGRLHRKDGPAVEYVDGGKEWWQQGRLHRIGGPAMEYADGTKVWWENGEGHRIGGPAVEYANGRKEWREHGELHREDGPAVEYEDGRKGWHWRGQGTNEATVVLNAQGVAVATYQYEKWFDFVNDHRLGLVDVRQYYLGSVSPQLANPDYEKILAELFTDGIVTGAIALPDPYEAKDFGLRIVSAARDVNGKTERDGVVAEIFLTSRPELKEVFNYELPFYLEEFNMSMSQTGSYDVVALMPHLINDLLAKKRK